MTLPIFYNSLDRRADRRTYMEEQLSALGLSAERHSAVDMTEVDEDELSRTVDFRMPRIHMSVQSACNAVSHLEMHRRFLETGAPMALMLEDDVALAQDLPALVRSAEWLPVGVGVVQLERYRPGRSPRLVGPPMAEPVPGRQIRRIYSRTGGSACYLITRQAAALVAGNAGRLTTPIDHLLFSPNASPLFRRLGVAVMMPAPARQNEEKFASDIAAAREERRKTALGRLRRAWFEINCLPRQVMQMAQGARWEPFAYAEMPETSGEGRGPAAS